MELTSQMQHNTFQKPVGIGIGGDQVCFKVFWFAQRHVNTVRLSYWKAVHEFNCEGYRVIRIGVIHRAVQGRPNDSTPPSRIWKAINLTIGWKWLTREVRVDIFLS